MADKDTAHIALLPDQKARQLIVEALDRNLLVEAAAGTGKTSSMVRRMVELVRTGNCRNIRTMAAVTFTRKAAAELRSRFRIKLEECFGSETGPFRSNLERAIQDMDQCFIGTIHSFCGRLLRERPVEAGIDPTFEELDEDADMLLRKEAWAEYSSRALIESSNGIVAQLEELDLRLQDLEETFLNFADYPDVTNWPATESKPDFREFEPVKREILNYISHMKTLAPRLPEEWGGDKLIPKYLRLPRALSHYGAMNRTSDVATMLGEFDENPTFKQSSWTRSCLFTKEEAEAEQSRWKNFRTTVVGPAMKKWREWRYRPIITVMLQAQVVYDEKRNSSSRLNYTDLLLRAVRLLRDKPHVRSYFLDRFSHLLVDEFQDTDPIQAEVILLLTSSDLEEANWKKAVPRPGSLFVVGDPKQSIYRFRRADIVTYNDVKDAIQKGKTRKGLVVKLSSNFRTVDNIIYWVNDVFEPKDTTSSELSGAVTRFQEMDSAESPRYVRLDSARRNYTSGSLTGVYSLTIPKECDNKEKVLKYEADRIARTIRQALDNPAITIPRTRQEIEQGKTARPEPSDFLIINRNKEWLSLYANKLEEYGIPAQVSGGSALNEVRELKMLHSCLNSLTHPDDPVALLAVLRGELFGFSDSALYEFKKAGGHFSFNSQVPSNLDTHYAAQFKDAFSRMCSYSVWLSKLPPIAGFERISADLGLIALSAIRPGGRIQAGSFSKAIEILRVFQHGSWTTAQIVDRLGQLSRETNSHDGISANPENRPTVRIMNLHKVKGLEAPVVFLACPYGDSEHDVEFNIDRSGDNVMGYLAVYGKKSKWRRPFLAHPTNWDELTKKESKFLKAESLRLRYVAATRAGSALIITRRNSGKGQSPWKTFHQFLAPDREIGEFAHASIPVRDKISVTRNDVIQAEQDIKVRVSLASRPTYNVIRAKDLALNQEVTMPEPVEASIEAGVTESDIPVEVGEYGVEWGAFIHTLLELAMKNPSVNLKQAIMMASGTFDFQTKHLELAEITVKNVMRSEIWLRAQKSDHRLLEVPFQVMRQRLTADGNMLPTILRGTIDLIFKENDGWILVDYKTDIVKLRTISRFFRKYIRQLSIYSEAWSECTGESVIEAGLYLVRLNKYVAVERQEPSGLRAS